MSSSAEEEGKASADASAGAEEGKASVDREQARFMSAFKNGFMLGASNAGENDVAVEETAPWRTEEEDDEDEFFKSGFCLGNNTGTTQDLDGAIGLLVSSTDHHDPATANAWHQTILEADMLPTIVAVERENHDEDDWQHQVLPLFTSMLSHPNGLSAIQKLDCADTLRRECEGIGVEVGSYFATFGYDEADECDECDRCGAKERDDYLLHFCNTCQPDGDGKGGFCPDCRTYENEDDEDSIICLDCFNKK